MSLPYLYLKHQRIEKMTKVEQISGLFNYIGDFSCSLKNVLSFASSSRIKNRFNCRLCCCCSTELV